MALPGKISPLLDGFDLGQPISKNGCVQCCIATERASGDKFIVKVIRTPESAVHLEAMLMTGAFSDRTAALNYYKEQARSVLNEAKCLNRMATLGGFVDYDGVQVVAAGDGGFEVYLLAPFRLSLHSLLARQELTQLNAINMSLDICAALATCRHAGFLYAGLKPGNIFCVCGHYRIGDLGFVPLSSVGHAPLPEHLRSPYAPAELRAGRTPLNDTADTYALGMMLYEIYNGGVLPQPDDLVGKLYAPPKYADYELAQIILRACAPDPAVRWHDPMQMSHALARYLHRNGIRNVPIVPASLQDLPEAQAAQPFLPETPPTEQELALVPEPSVQEPHAPPVPKKRTKRRSALIIAVLALLLALELGIGAWLLLRPQKIDIQRFSARTTGTGVSISLTYEGDASDGWELSYCLEGQPPQTVTFFGHQVDLTGLQAGATYHFTVSAQGRRTLSGQTELRFTVPAE